MIIQYESSDKRSNKFVYLFNSPIAWIVVWPSEIEIDFTQVFADKTYIVKQSGTDFVLGFSFI